VSNENIEPLVTTAWLADNLHRSDIKVIDSSFYLPTEKRDPRAEFEQAHIPGSVFFDVDAISDDNIPLPHMFPDEQTFADEVGRLGISNNDTVICYDGSKTTGACRAWWMFRAFGHDRVALLDGGFLKWKAEQRPTENGQKIPSPVTFQARFQPAMVRSLEQVLATVRQSVNAQILDARSQGRFEGTAPEPRAGMRSGHMPGALNLPYDRLLNNDGTFKSPEQLRHLFDTAGLQSDKPVITSCGSGISAATLLMGLHLLGRKDISLYDGSWAEWGSRSDTPVVT
jgi:thiosulfate/3-mercaptopyruvate sulfurtransferase